MIDLATSVTALSPQVTAPQGIQKVAAEFDDSVFSAIGQVDKIHGHADNALELLASGQQVDLHGTMIALEKADIALRTMVSVRDKVVGAYEQIMNMAI